MSRPPAKRNANPGAIDESAESEIVIHPDGRVFAFGITRSVVEVMAALPSARGAGRRALDRIRAHHGEQPSHE